MAYIRVLRGRIDPAKANEVSKFAPAVNAKLKSLPGCAVTQLGIDKASGATTAISTWDTLEQAQWSLDAISDEVAPLLALGWKRESSEVFETLE